MNKRRLRKVDNCIICNNPLYREKKDICKDCSKTILCLVCNNVSYKKGLCRSHYNKQRLINKPKCKIDGCDNISRSKGLCAIHYKELLDLTRVECSINNCNKKISKKGFCENHYRQNRLKLLKLSTSCNKDNCNNPTHKKNLCYKHWYETISDLDKFKKRIRTRIVNDLKRILNNKKASKTEDVIGISFDKLKIRFESMFSEGMSWDNYGVTGWTIDHICPCSQAQNEEEIKRLQHYSNLRPMWNHDNIVKSNNPTEEAIQKCKELLGRDWIF